MTNQWKFRRLAIFIYVLGGLTTSLSAAGSLSEYTGSFQIDNETTLKIRETEHGLVGEIPNRPVFQLKASGTDRFDVVGIQVKLVFLRSRKGDIQAVEIRQPLTDVLANRTGMDGGGEVAEPTGVEVPVATLERYVGRYVVMGFYVVEISLDGSQLYFRPPKHDAIPLIAESETIFKVTGREAKVEFKLEGEGPAPNMLLHENNKVKALRRVTFKHTPKK